MKTKEKSKGKESQMLRRKSVKGLRLAFATSGEVEALFADRRVPLGSYGSKRQLCGLIQEAISTGARSVMIDGRVDGKNYNHALGTPWGMMFRFFGPSEGTKIIG
jgi:hypothetical protein